jgi:hypothetical protein
MKIRLLRPELFHADGQTDMTKLLVAFRHLRTRLKMCVCVCVCLHRRSDPILLGMNEIVRN